MFKRDIYVLLFLLCMMMFTYPGINMFDGALVAYFHAAWALFIVLVVVVSYKHGG